MRRPRHGLTIIELLVAMAIALLGFFTLLTVIRSNYEQSNQSRNRTLACEVMQSLMDEVEEHPYGLPKPPEWDVADENVVTLFIEGRPQEVQFHKKIEYLNRSFIGAGQGDTDMVTITLSWKEGVGQDMSSHPVDDRELVVQVPVWR